MNIRKLEIEDGLPITTAAARKALRIDHAFEDDTLERKLRAAVELVEEKTGHVLRPTTFEVTFDAWPRHCDAELCLAMVPIRSVSEVSYYPEAGPARLPVAPAEYDWRRVDNGGELYFFASFSQPAISTDRRGPIAVKFEAGYDTAAGQAGDDPELKIPSRIVELVLLLAGHWMKNREAVDSGDLAEVPFSAKLLFEELRIFR